MTMKPILIHTDTHTHIDFHQQENENLPQPNPVTFPVIDPR